MKPFELVPIGVARTPCPTRRGIPRQGAGPARIEIEPRFAEALVGLERSSHVWVMAWFHLAYRHILRAKSRRAQPHESPHGVFSMRTPVRPNPISLSVARLLGVDGRTVLLDKLDLVDGTPVLDIKPYSPGWDMIPSAIDSHRYLRTHYTTEELREALARDAQRALGDHALDSLRVRRALAALERLVMEYDVDPRNSDLEFTIPKLDGLVELLLSSCAAGFGNGRMHYDPDLPDEVVFEAVLSERRWRFVEAQDDRLVREQQAQ